MTDLPKTILSKNDIRPVDLQVKLTHGDIKNETCCNYHIVGKSGGMMLVLPAMTHIQDMTREA